ncbi:MAG: hypothetical protein MUE44_34675 [Oscillatoriaceae cyanobacterium Prado104]|jgi:hypothetical protein|nr:hypothetical protein [Oscillatoriaceae cyanobacterium Prado104]
MKSTTFIGKLIEYMERQNYRIFRRPHEKNIVYIEGVDSDLNLNPDRANEFNDARIVFEFVDRDPVILGRWDATTEPGYHYTDNPMNPKGAARIAFNQYTAWQVGIHGYSEPHESLIQVEPVGVWRDWNRDMIRTGDKFDEGLFGINQHWGYDHPRNDIHTASAGCLVGQTREGHRNFMRLVKLDPRYQADKNFVFTTTVIDGSKI